MTMRRALLLAAAALAVMGQSPGTMNLQGPSTAPGAPQITPGAVNTAVNSQLTSKVDVTNGALTNPTITGGGTFAGAFTNSGSLTLTGTNPSPLQISGTVGLSAGSLSSLLSSTNYTGSYGGAFTILAAHKFNINSYTSHTGSAGGFNDIYAGSTLSAGFTGNFTSVNAVISMSGTSSNAIGSGRFYTALAGQSSASVNDNGTMGVGNGAGALFGALLASRLNSGATFWLASTGMEVDVTTSSGASVAYKKGVSVVREAADAVQGSLEDAAYIIANQPGAATGWKVGLSFGSPVGVWPMDAAATLIGTQTTALGGPAYGAADGVDFTAITFTDAAFKSTGFSVSPTGALTAASYKVGSTAGVTCAPGSPTASFAVTNGIVVHC